MANRWVKWLLPLAKAIIKAYEMPILQKSDGVAIDTSQVLEYLADHFSDVTIRLADEGYKLYTFWEVRGILDTWTPPWPYTKESWDCDDDARDMMNLLRAKLLGIAVFQVEGWVSEKETHRWICYVGANGTVYEHNPRSEFGGMIGLGWKPYWVGD